MLQTINSPPATVSQCHPGLQRRHAYKVILVASSAVSGGIPRKDPHPYPLVYMKGVVDQHII